MLAALVVKMLWFPGSWEFSDSSFCVNYNFDGSRTDARSERHRRHRSRHVPRSRILSQQTSIDSGSHIQPLRPGFDFPRQTLRYEAEYRFWTAGVATLRVERSGNQEHVSGTADSTGVVALLFRVQDRFNSYFDATALCSSKLVKHTEEGSHWRDTTITFDYSRGKAILEEKNLKTTSRSAQKTTSRDA